MTEYSQTNNCDKNVEESITKNAEIQIKPKAKTVSSLAALMP